MPFEVGDTVRAKPNSVKVPVGSVGSVSGFSTAGGHPLVDFTNKGRCLIKAEHLEPYDGPLPSRTKSEDRVPLAETPAHPSKIAVPQAVWTPEDAERRDAAQRERDAEERRARIADVERAAPGDSVSRETENGNSDKARAELAQRSAQLVERPVSEPSSPAKPKRGGWSAERRAKFRATMAAKREGNATVPAAEPEPETASVPVPTVAVAETPKVIPQSIPAPLAALDDGAFDLGHELRSLVAEGLRRGAEAGRIRVLVEVICQWEEAS